MDKTDEELSDSPTSENLGSFLESLKNFNQKIKKD
jgi:hypothetical protein